MTLKLAHEFCDAVGQRIGRAVISAGMALLTAGVTIVPLACSNEVKLETNAMTVPAEAKVPEAAMSWHLVGKNELASVEVEKKLYDRDKDGHFFVLVRVSNLSDGPIGVDLHDYWMAVHPNQWGWLDGPKREVINERRTLRLSPPTAQEKERMSAEFKNQRLAMLKPGEMLEYWHDFNAKRVMRGQIGGKYLFVSMDGELRITDGREVTQVDCDWATGAREADTDLVIAPPISWGLIPARGLVMEDGKVEGKATTIPAAAGPATRAEAVGELVGMLRAGLPAGWTVESEAGEFLPRHWTKAGKGVEIRLTEIVEALAPPNHEFDDAPIVHQLWLMEPGYDGEPGKPGAHAEAPQKDPAVEWGLWRGGKVICEEPPLGKMKDVLAKALAGTESAADRSPETGAATKRATRADKGNAGDDALAEARRDIEGLKKTLKTKSPEELIAAFIPDSSTKRYGGRDYYYNYMANVEIRRELESRGQAAEPALQKHRGDQTRIWEAANGPGYTVGRICKELLRSEESKLVPATRGVGK